MIKVVNAVAGGELKTYIDLDELERALPAELMSNLTQSGLHISECDDCPTITLFRSGKYSIAGAKSVNQLFDLNKEFLNMLSEITGSELKPEFEVRYLVGIGDVGAEVNLEKVTELLPVSKVEYEPEQFPGLFYNPSENTTIIIFSTGKVSINGPVSKKKLIDELDEVRRKVSLIR